MGDCKVVCFFYGDVTLLRLYEGMSQNPWMIIARAMVRQAAAAN
jgi:hypothetical protein